MSRQPSLVSLFKQPLIRRLLRTPIGWAAIAVAAVAWYGFELQMRDGQVYAGVPESQGWQLPGLTRVFRNEGFMVGYSEWRAAPLWVTYELQPVRVPKRMKRPGSFSIDDRSLRRVSHDDYTGSGYDRGHMAPNHAIAQIYGRAAQRDTFLMSNVVPQKARLNQELWQRLEEVALSHFARQGRVWVMTGPVYGATPAKLKSGVEVPDAFYKIFLREPKKPGGEPSTLAFLMPQKVRGNEDLRDFVTSIDAIEDATGLNFFPRLDDWVEDKVEARSSHAGWRLASVANLPGRYARSRRR